jgi:hypothetical protein
MNLQVLKNSLLGQQVKNPSSHTWTLAIVYTRIDPANQYL